MPFSHRLAGYVPGFGLQLGVVAIRSRHTGSYAAEHLRLANIVNVPFGSTSGLGLVSEISKFGQPQARDSRGQFMDVPNVITRFGPVTGTAIASGVVTVTIASGHNIQTGEDITIRQVVGSTEINGFFDGSRVRRLTDTTFSISGVASITAFSASADSIVEVQRPFPSVAISGFVNATGVFTTATAHGLLRGDKIFISQVTGLTFTGPTWLNRMVTVATAPTATTFTIFENAPLTGAASGGNVTAVRTVNNFGLVSIRQPRTIALASVSNANPALFTTGVSHGLQIGDRVVVNGVQGTAVTALNTVGVIRTTPAANTFTLESGVGAPVSGAGSTATANTGFLYAGNSQTIYTALDEEFSLEIPMYGSPYQPTIRRGPFQV
jgi:hypothetical protein